jgi:hypothetical protein
MSITSQDRLDLKKMMDEMDCGDNTENIRKAKHSILLRDDIRKMEVLKQKNDVIRRDEPETFRQMAMNECVFMYGNYMDIFTKVFNDELDLDIMSKLLQILKMIEDGQVDQHEGSILVGKILKELYIDSAVRRADNLDKKYNNHDVDEKEEPVIAKNISWREFKNIRIYN